MAWRVNRGKLRSDAFTQGHSEEVGFVVDEKNNSARPKRTRVLRAADVMPPFGKPCEETDCQPSDQAAPQSGDGDPRVDENTAAGPIADNASGPDAGVLPAGEGEIPTYDLAENILAEQRRVAARRRRAPSQAQEEAIAGPPSDDYSPSLDGRFSEDLPELQRIVAEIVAKDIDRLCRRPAK